MSNTTTSKGIEWVTVAASADGGVRIMGLHRSKPAADRYARKNGGWAVSTPSPRTDDLALRIGDRCRVDNGMCLPL